MPFANSTPDNYPGPGASDDAQGGDDPETGDENQTAFIPMDVFDKTPSIGDVCTFKVVDVSKDGDVEVEYVSSTSGKEKTSGPTPPWETADEETPPQGAM